MKHERAGPFDKLWAGCPRSGRAPETVPFPFLAPCATRQAIDDQLLLSIDWALRGGACALALLLAGTTLRELGHSTTARLGAAFALGTAAYAVTSAAGFRPSAWTFPIVALSAGNNAVFWLLASALFDDGFRLRRWHGAVWFALIVAGSVGCLWLGPRPTGSPGLLNLGLILSSLGFAALAIALTLASWRADLVEGRRRMRLFVVGASGAYIALTALLQLLGTFHESGVWGSIAGAAGLLAIVGMVAWSMLHLGPGQSLFLVEAMPIAAPVIEVPPPIIPQRGEPEPIDPILVARLEHAMMVERVARQDGLTIGVLAQRLDLPEYRLRRLINQALGFRNFNAFLNHYRIAEVKAALADPAQAAVPVLTLALDAGFSSLGPFNRAFKAEAGRTPSEFRRQALGSTEESEFGQPIPESASSRSNPASDARAAR